MKKIKLAIIFGGKNTEHEVSVRTAKSVYNALDKEKYDVVLLGIDKKGNWLQLPVQELRQVSDNTALVINSAVKTIATQAPNGNLHLHNTDILNEADVVFPLMHGTGGEDGMIQGFLQTLGIPYIGTDILGSALGMNKIVTKMILRQNEIEVADYTWANGHEVTASFINDTIEKLGLPLFVKSASQGSSVGIIKVHTGGEMRPAIKEALKYDGQILFERAIEGKELEVAVLGNRSPQASVVGEVIPQGHEFYDYEAKYLDENGARLEIPADLPEQLSNDIRETALTVFRLLQCKGMARVDFFLTKENKILVNEINTIPGFTSISMYPKLWEATGLPYGKLLDKLIELALEKY